jgi:hypothetical protein
MEQPVAMIIAEKNITVSAGVTRIPSHLQITPTMVDDFLCDPVLAAYVIMGIKLDVFQACRLRLMWWTPNVIDSSGFGTGKSLGMWLWMALRAMMIGDQQLCVYFQTFDAAKNIFWPYFRTFDRRRAPIFDAQLGKIDAEGDIEGKDNTRGPACYKQYFKNDSLIMAPAPNWFQDAKGQAGLTFNGVGVDEWTKVETMTKKTSRVTNEKGDAVGGINQQIMGRVRRASWNQFHPLWGNHMVFMATAESLQHPGYRRYQNFLKAINSGDTDYGVFSACFKDFSNQVEETDIRIEDIKDDQGKVVGRELKSTKGKPIREVIPNWKRISNMRNDFTRAHFLREVLGIWARETKGWYAEAALERCMAVGLANNLEPEVARNNALGNDVHYFLGYDPAPAQKKSADDAGLVTLRVRPRPGLAGPPSSNVGDWLAEFVWAYRMRGEVKRNDQDGVLFASTTRQMSGRVHTCHRQFGMSGILMDHAGGGNLVMPELNKSRQILNGVETEVTPIACPDDVTVANATFILNMFMRRDGGVAQLWPLLVGDDGLYEAMHIVFQEAVEHANVSWPVPFNERPGDATKDWSAEKRWALINLDEMRRQLVNIHAATNDDGTWQLSKNCAKSFSAVGKKDLAYAGIFAFVRFLIWLKMGEFEFGREQEGEVGIYSVG